ncbi:hypothetical protein L914_19049, partial [Phytophthora nicotianae]
NMGLLLNFGCHRLQDFVANYGCYVTTDLLESLLDLDDFASSAPRTRLINAVVAAFRSIQPETSPLVFGPPRLSHIEAAFHEWSFDGVSISKLANRDFVLLMLKLKPTRTPMLQLEQLQLSNFMLEKRTWTQEFGWDRHILPVCADLKFRLQHNALGVRYKFGYRTSGFTSTECIHGCEHRETAIHLFWHCSVAHHQWAFFLSPFKDLIVGDFAWQMIIFPGSIRFRDMATAKHGVLALQVVFSILRCCVFRSLWLHRNKKLYNPETETSAAWVKHHAYAYVKLHLHKYGEFVENQGLTPAVKLVQYVSAVLRMDLSSMTMDMDTTTAASTLPTPIASAAQH